MYVARRGQLRYARRTVHHLFIDYRGHLLRERDLCLWRRAAVSDGPEVLVRLLYVRHLFLSGWLLRGRRDLPRAFGYHLRLRGQCLQ